MEFTEKTLDKRTIYNGKFINVELQTVMLPDGKITTRDIVTHPGASVIVPIDENNEIYLVRQYRKPIERLSLELPAGKLDKGEKPVECARRELLEETGLIAGDIKHVISVHSTPGFSNELLHIFMATDLKSAGPACTDSDEFLTCGKFPISKLIEMIYDNVITDAKTIIGILLAERSLNRQL
jgi:ADP-ribose pyrophosphatase